MSEPIRLAIDRAMVVFGGGQGLMPELAADAVLARARSGEIQAAVPRLLELMTDDQLGDVEPWTIARLFEDQSWRQWSDEQRECVEAVLDAWWSTLLVLYPFEPGVDDVLATLAVFGLPLVRWLLPLLESLDGSGTLHVRDIVLGGLPGPGWREHQAARLEILGWCRSEPVVMGLAVVGGVHLAPGELGLLLDELL